MKKGSLLMNKTTYNHVSFCSSPFIKASPTCKTKKPR